MANSWEELKKQAQEQIPLVTEEWAAKVVVLRSLDCIEFPMYKYFVRKKPTPEDESPRVKSFTDTFAYKKLVQEIEEENGLSDTRIDSEGNFEEDPNTEMFVFLQYVTVRLKDIRVIQEAHNGLDALKAYNYIYTTIWTKTGSYITPVPYHFFLTRFAVVKAESIRMKILDDDYYHNAPDLKINGKLYKKYSEQMKEMARNTLEAGNNINSPEKKDSDVSN